MNKKIEIEKLELMQFNPRFNDLIIKGGGYNSLWEKTYLVGNEISQEEIAVEILTLEEDFDDFILLAKSLSDGFNEELDRMIVIETKRGKNIVAEGNRRLLAIKLLTNKAFRDSVFEKFTRNITKDHLVDNAVTSENIYYDSETSEIIQENTDVTEEKGVILKTSFIKSTSKMFEEINKISIIADENMINKKVIEVIFYSESKEFSFSKIEDTNKIDDSVLSRSASAPQGKRRWPRFQTLKNSWDIYEYYFEIDEKTALEKTSKRLMKSQSSVKLELTYAKFIMIIKKFYSGAKLSENLNGNWKLLRTTAIEMSLDVIKIDDHEEYETNIPLRNFLNFENKIDNINLSFQNVSFRKKEISDFEEKLSNFLVDHYINGYYSTRGWKINKSKKPIYEFLGMNFINEENTFGNMDSESIDKIRESAQKFKSPSIEVIRVIDDIKDAISKMDSSEKANGLRESILLYARRLFDLEIPKLFSNFDTHTLQTYPYFIAASIARNIFEISYVYCMTESKKFRKKISSHMSNKYESYFKNSEGEFRENLDFSENFIEKANNANDLSSFLKAVSGTMNVDGSKNSTIQTSIEVLVVDDNFLSECLGKMNNVYENNLFNRVVHTPYIYTMENLIEKIPEIFDTSLKIIEIFREMIRFDYAEKLKEIPESIIE